MIYTNILDIPLAAPGKIVQSLRRLLQYVPSFKGYLFKDVLNGVSHCFTTTSTLDDGHSIGPLSQTTSDEPQRWRISDIENGKNHYLKPGQWAIILIQEAFDADNQEVLDQHIEYAAEKDRIRAFKPQKRLRYMLARAIPDASRSTPRYQLVDVPEYIT
ncbi:MAG: hypothetical protein Q9174_006090 [Haloplaca sp. 1 TL-2023]